jgi:DNA polymerase
MVETNGVDVVACERCPDLVACRNRIVNGDGPEDATICLVGEAPGVEEDRRGTPFVGRSGDVLTEALRGAGLPHEAVRIVNCVRCRPPENRDPHRAELEHCREFLEAEIASVDPEVVVSLGKVPAEHLLGRSVGVTNEAGSVETARLGGRSRRIVISVHPAAPLYDPSQRESLNEALATAADLAGDEVGHPASDTDTETEEDVDTGADPRGREGGQSRLDDF